MKRRRFIIRTIGAFALAAARPTLARAASLDTGASVTAILRHGTWGAIPGGCGDARRVRSMHAAYTRADALERFAR